MRLRSGRVYSYRFQDHLESRRADRKLSRKMTPPTPSGSDPTTSLQNPVLFYLTLITAMLPEPLVKCFDEKLQSDSSELDIYRQVRKHLSKCTDLDPSLIQDFTKQENKNHASTSPQ